MRSERAVRLPDRLAAGWAIVSLAEGDYFVRSPGLIEYVPVRPRIALDDRGIPQFSAALLLRRCPRVSDARLDELIVMGRLEVTLSLGTPDAAIKALRRQFGRTVRPAFLSSLTVSLAGRQTDASAAVSGTDAQVVLDAHLDEEAARALLYSVCGITSDLAVQIRTTREGPSFEESPLDDLLGALGMEALAALRSRLSVGVLKGDGALLPAPRLWHDLPMPGAGRRDAASSLPAVEDAQGVLALPLVMAPAPMAQAGAAALITSPSTVYGGALSAHQSYYLAADIAVPASTVTETLLARPLIDDLSAPLWTDARDGHTRWYAPSFRLIAPAPSDDPHSASFAFVYRTTTPAVGANGVKPGLEADIHFALQVETSSAVTAALQALGTTPSRMLALAGLSVALELSYREAGSAASKTQRFQTSVTLQGAAIIARLSLLDDWVRIAYAALADPAPDSASGPNLIVQWTFPCYFHVRMGQLNVVSGGKVSRLEALTAVQALPTRIEQAILIKDANILQLPGGSSVQFAREETRRANAMLQAASRIPLSVRPPTRLPRPPVHVPVVPAGLASRTIGREDRVNASMPCDRFGNFYLQDLGTSWQAMGCQSAFRLGETSPVAFAEILALADAACRVFRSLQQPQRFLLLPHTYRVGRFSSSDVGRAFRPMIMLYGALNDDEDKDQYFLTATLIPDISEYKKALLRTALSAYTPAGTLAEFIYPTDSSVSAQASVSWTVPAELAQPLTTPLLDAFVVTLTMGKSGALLVTKMIDRDGISAVVSFLLPDGTSLTSAVELAGRVVGPLGSGPVSAQVSAGSAMLANHTAQRLNIEGLALVDASGTARAFDFTATLEAGASEQVSLPEDVQGVEAEAVLPGAVPIEELDVFVEDVDQSVAFINQVNFANHGLLSLAVQSRMVGTAQVMEAALPEGQSISMNFTLPITAYLAPRSLEFALVETTAAGTSTTAWRTVALADGAVVGITPDLL